MASVLKSEIFEDGVHRREMPSNVGPSTWYEKEISVQSKHVEGVVQEIQLDGILLVINTIQAPKGCSCEVLNDFDKFKLHFEITGDYSYKILGSIESLVQIPEFHYNLCYLPSTEGEVAFKGTPRRSVEMYFTTEFIKKIAGPQYEQVFSRSEEAVGQNKPLVFWNQSCPITPEMFQSLESIMDCPHSGDLKKTYLQSQCTTLLVDILVKGDNHLRGDCKDRLSKQDLEKLTLIEEHIRTNLSKNLSIKDLASLAGCNTSKLKHDFKELYGTTIFKHITKLRMEKAQMLIRTEAYSVAQAAYEVGYANPQHFSKAFKRTMGYLPRELKQ